MQSRADRVSESRASWLAVLALTASLAAGHASAHDGEQDDPQDVERNRIVNAFGWDFAAGRITTEKLTDKLHVLFGIGGNVLVSTGDQGVLLVDNQFPQMLPKIQQAVRDLGGDGVDFAINTHWHFDHADGNLTLGPTGTWLVSHESSREKMLGTNVINLVSDRYTQRPYPPKALPVITYDASMQFHFNGERIDLMHFGPAHTTGDTAVIFRESNVVHMGDVFNNAGYPFIDADNGGSIDGVISFCSAVLEQINADTRVVPGHGPVSDYDGLAAYVAMLEVVRDRIKTLIDQGADLEAILAARPTAGFDEKYGDPRGLVDRAHASLSRMTSPSPTRDGS